MPKTLPLLLSLVTSAVFGQLIAPGDNASTPVGVAVTFNIATNDIEANNNADPATIDLDPSIFSPGAQKTVSNNDGEYSVTDTGDLTFTPAAGFSGTATLSYSISGFLLPGQITITVINSGPVANDDTGVVAEGGQVTILILENDTDDAIGIDPGTVDLDPGRPGRQNDNSTDAGEWSVDNQGELTFEPNDDFSGAASITYTVRDTEEELSNIATVTITVNAVNDPPVANDDAGQTAEESNVTINVVQNDTDNEGPVDAGTVDLIVSTDAIDQSTTTDAGAWSVDNNGVVSFTPVLNFVGPATLAYTVRDAGGATSNQATITITVNNVNDAPEAKDDAASTNEETTGTVDVIANDTDLDGNGTINKGSVDLNTGTVAIESSHTTDQGNWSVNGNGVVSFTPVAGFVGQAPLPYRVSDNSGAASNIATITFTVIGVNDAPQARGDNGATQEETAVTINVLENDTDDGTINANSVDLNTGSPGIQKSNNTDQGNWSVDTNGVVTFTPAKDFIGTASITYTVNDNDGETSNAATISITVSNVNDLPVATNDAFSTDEDQEATFNILTNDRDVDGSLQPSTVDLDPSSAGIQNTVDVAGGTINTVNSTGTIRYVPAKNFFGTVTARYTVADNEGGVSNAATITITVNSVNDPPVANNDLAAAEENETVTVNVLENDIDIDGSLNIGTVDLNTSQTGIQTSITTSAGIFTVNSSGVVTFDPNENYNGIATTTYTVRDNAGATSNAATISINVNSVNSVPIAADDAVTTPEDTPVQLNVVQNDRDPDGTINAATVDLDTGTPGIQNSFTTDNGTFTIPTSGTVRFTPAQDVFGVTTITYAVDDNVGATSNAAKITVTVTSVNDKPVAVADAATTPENTAVTITILANDKDVDGTLDATKVDLNTAAAGIQNPVTVTGGTFAANSAGVVTFTPTTGYSGKATTNYRVPDNEGAESNAVAITVTVNSVNDAPVANDDAATTKEDVTVTIRVLDNDDDDDGLNTGSVDLNPSTAGIQNTFTTAGPGGTFTVNGSGVVSFKPSENYTGTAAASYTVNDNQSVVSNAATITVTIEPQNDAPVAKEDAATTSENTAVTFSVIANDTDADGTIDPATVDLNTSQAGIQGSFTNTGGTFTANTNGSVTFTPATNFSGSTTANYRVNDNSGATSNTATITVSVDGINDPPAFDPISDQVVLENSGAQTITITGVTKGAGEDAQQLTWFVSSGNTNIVSSPTITYNGTGKQATLKYNVEPDATGTVVVTVNVVDNGSNVSPNRNSYTQTFTVNVVEVNFTSTPVTVAVRQTPYVYDITITDVDPTLTIAAAQKPAWATLTSTGKNRARLSGTPGADVPASSVVTLQIKQGSKVLATQEFTLKVNRRPVVQPVVMTLEEDQSKAFEEAAYTGAFSDPDQGDVLAEVQFPVMPRHGDLLLNGTAITPATRIAASSLPNIVYRPAQDFVGQDTLYWKASDGMSYSVDSARVELTVTPVNDAPVITELETEPLEHEIAEETPQPITKTFTITDPDNTTLASAEIGFRLQTFDLEKDRLVFTNTGKITGNYNQQAGTLLLAGEATIQEYIDAIRSIQYVYVNFDEIEDATKNVYINVFDGNLSSETKERPIKLVYTFQDIDIPNTFTPNGDGSNDVWKIVDADNSNPAQYEQSKTRVYDKRGRLVFESKGFSASWDGTIKGEALPPDTYYYTIDLQYGNKRYKGIVTILK
ncbi:tandem-95 repeat protein [Fulvivirgaceae bacterium PWU5]|uniref:Tandem-95 repeat protein n=1 Tax=Dawidia cretensis TaxID=2782350 RepID=A0AAP2DUE2_9BACT|nr:Ig-like domain-containing protein [Dawidia cretensis]MBT1707421.1 tandem-95 repeat protein [Dawidia cretensis]